MKKFCFSIASNGVKEQNRKENKQELLKWLKENDDVEEQGLNETANNANNSRETIVIIPCYEEIIKTQSKKQ